MSVIPARSPAAGRALLGVSGIFLVSGTIVGCLPGHFAALKARLGADDAQFSVALMCMAAGTILALALGSRPIGRFGSMPVVAASGMLAPILFMLPVVSDSMAALALALFALGIFSGLLDVSMNVQASTVERLQGRLVMTRIHALYSVGGILGAFTTGLALDRVSPLAHAASLALLSLGFVAVCVTLLLPGSADRGPKGGRVALPRLSLLPVAFLAFLVLFCAAAMRDWSAIYLNQGLGTDHAIAGLGFAAFSAATAVGRLFGDRMRKGLGPRFMLVGGGCLGAAALTAGLWLQTPGAVIAGLAMLGLAHAGLVPMLFSLAGQEPKGEPAGNIGAVMTVGFLGYIAAPPLIGLVSGQADLRAGLLTVALASAVVAGMGLLMPYRQPRNRAA